MALRLSVIIVNYNVKELLSACISSLYRNLPSNELEIIVVDNDSKDGSENFIRSKFPEIVWIGNNYNAGFSAANNQGMMMAKADVFFLLNPDTELFDDVLSGLLSKQKIYPTNVIIPKLLNSDGSLQNSCWRFPSIWDIIFEAIYLHRFININNYPQSFFDRQFNPDSASGAAMIFGRNILNTTGGLDENLFWSEDIDFCFTASKRGSPLIYFPEYKIYHHSGKSSISNLNIPISNQLLSKAKYLRKHQGLVIWLISLFFILLHIVTRILVFGILSIFKSEPYRLKRKAYVYTLWKYFQYVFMNSKSLT